MIVAFVVFVILRKEPYERPFEGEGPYLGDEDAEVTITMFSSFTDTSCKAFAESGKLQEVLDAYPGKVKFVFRNFAGDSLGKLAAEAALCADDQGLFWEMHDSLFSNQASLSESALSYYTISGLSKSRYRDCMSIRKYKGEVEAGTREGINFKVNILPSFFIDGSRIEGNAQVSEFKTFIDAELE